MSEQPVTFASLKERWRKTENRHLTETERDIAEGYERAADELESLEQQVQELRTECHDKEAECVSSHKHECRCDMAYGEMFKKLTALLGREG